MIELRKSIAGLACALSLAGLTCVNSARAQVTAEQLVVAGHPVGHVEAFILDGLLYMDISTVGGYTIDAANVAVGATLGDIPADSRGRPVAANFPIVETGGTDVQDIFLIIPLDPSYACDVPLVVATQVTVRDNHSALPVPLQAWAGTLPFPAVADDVLDDGWWDRDCDRDRSRHHDGRDRDGDRRCKDRDGRDRDYDRDDDRDREDRDSGHGRSGKRSRDCQEGRECNQGGGSHDGHRSHDRSDCRDRDGRDRDCDRDDHGDGWDRDGHRGDCRDRDHDDDQDDDCGNSDGSGGNATYMLVDCLPSDSPGGGPAF